MGEVELYMRVCQCHALEFGDYMSELGGVRFEELASGGDVEEEASDAEYRSRGA